jgi:hypothetical protein
LLTVKSSCGNRAGRSMGKLYPGAGGITAYVAPCSRPAGGSTRTGRNEDDGVLSGPLGDSSERDGREHLASEHLANVPHGGVREAPPPIFTVFGKIPGGLFSVCRRDLEFCTKASAVNTCRPSASPLALQDRLS